ncbi:MAG TPA: molybdopterin-dependent oxidoreductase, partial [Thermomicrobiales bacterium]|nr:molybdopterin-dependent oxidoreductase [Thermomicrobiales bacterium]
MEFIDIESAPKELLRRLGKDERLIAYGGANFGMPLELIEPGLKRTVPNDQFFVRSNGPVPTIDPSAWRLRIRGLVERELELSLDELRALPQRALTAFIECAGNGRTRFDPIPEGTPWKNDAAGN